MTSTDLTHLRELLAKATPGPWRIVYPDADEVQSFCICEPDETALGTIADFFNYSDEQDKANAEWVLAICNAAPGLLDDLTAANEQVAALRVELAKATAELLRIRTFMNEEKERQI